MRAVVAARDWVRAREVVAMGNCLFRRAIVADESVRYIAHQCTYTLSGDYSMTFSHPKGARTTVFSRLSPQRFRRITYPSADFMDFIGAISPDAVIRPATCRTSGTRAACGIQGEKALHPLTYDIAVKHQQVEVERAIRTHRRLRRRLAGSIDQRSRSETHRGSLATAERGCFSSQAPASPGRLNVAIEHPLC